MAETHNDGSETDFDLTQFYQIFFEEAGENLDQMEQMLLNLDLDAANDEELNGISVVPTRSRGDRRPSVSPTWPS